MKKIFFEHFKPFQNNVPHVARAQRSSAEVRQAAAAVLAILRNVCTRRYDYVDGGCKAETLTLSSVMRQISAQEVRISLNT